MSSDDLTRRGITAMQAHDLATARALLTQATQQNPQDELAWLWLSGALPDPAQQRACLQRVLAINPANNAARRGLAALAEAAAAPVASPASSFPATSPTYSSAGTTTIPLNALLVAEALPPSPPAPSPEDPAWRELAQRVLGQLQGGADRDVVVRLAAEQGQLAWSAAEDFVGAVEARNRNAIRSGQRLLWFLLLLGALAGIVVLALFFWAVATQPGGHGLARPTSGRQQLPSGLSLLLCFLAGGFTLVGAICDWPLLLESRKARLIVAILGRDGARVFYAIIGSVIILVSIVIGLR